MKVRNIRRKLIGVLVTAVLLAGIGITASASDLDQAKAQNQPDSSVSATQNAVEIRYASDGATVESNAAGTDQSLAITVLDDEETVVAAADDSVTLADEAVPMAAAPAETSMISFMPLYGVAAAVIVVLVLGVVFYVRTTREKAEYVGKRERIRKH